ETRKQSEALETELKRRGVDARVFIAMRYWSPYAKDTVREVEAYAPDHTVLLPLYPQFSTTTTASSLKSWRDAGGPPASTVCCFPTEPAFAAAHVKTILDTWEKGGRPDNVRVLFSAHGLPEKVVLDGDPYQHQVEGTVAAVSRELPREWEFETCYQSRVGPLKWIGPATDESIRRAAEDGKAILVAPIAFVSEHIETLVELDHEYGLLAKAAGAKTYLRAPALGVEPGFLAALANLVEAAIPSPAGSVRSHCGHRICPAKWSGCPNHTPAPEGVALQETSPA
ncbi:MAG: ferrochelatase, partial [Hyphomonadaceae bacterium]